MPSVRIPLADGTTVLLSVTDNMDGTFSPDVISVAESGVASSIAIPLQAGGVAKLATFLDNGVHTLAAVSV